ncbi:MAG TPA: T9SS type A sorting domain-containing protein [Flavobacteriales bacterium]|jgi:hypothetical protein|nr:Omp28-related outer membrane protein [Flavobacteriales bacterium]MBK7249129.1 Omp28-related outer membrane protein [Flavobacteriales bacterium]QQS71359.1 MAG: Omp28-related outer membrane protein [Flavobacteriales bacterium]HQV38378.1 T9SS type A sorting domain-containing protein [Flavobacteriales bacterium]HQW31925.1 T9SS type A sorting domain-containing protein [Flavobacteriales bacterium]
MKKLLLISALAILGGNTVQAQCPTGEVPVTVSIWTDAYGTETTWTLVSAGNTLASGGPYADQTSAGAFAQTPVTVCVTLGASVVFTITDAYGDGMCCAYGEGHYDVSMNGCTTVASGGEFTTSASTTFTTTPQIPLDLEMISVNLTDVALGGSPVNISGQIKNSGATNITSYDLNYSVDGSALVTQSMTNTIPSCGTYDFTHNTPWSGDAGYHTVVISVSNVNGTTDGMPSNDSKTITTSMATQTVSRVATVEEFGSSTCPPCFPFAENFTPAVDAFNTNEPGSNVVTVEYHMNWPSPGNDRSYNPDGTTRRGYYGVNGIPSPWIDGREMGGYTTAEITGDINTALNVPAFMDLDVSYTLSGTAITVTSVVTPHFDVPSGYKLYVAVTENLYTGTTTVSGYNPYDFHDTMRKMLPNGNGTTLGAFVDGVPQTYTHNYTLTEGNPQQGNYNLWGTVDGISVVAFVQKTATDQIFQGAIATLSSGVTDLGRDNSLVSVWPNPTSGTVNLRYGKTTNSPVQVEVYNVLGDRVMDTQRSFTTGQTQLLDLTNLDNGMYLLSVTADGVRSTSRVTVNK